MITYNDHNNFALVKIFKDNKLENIGAIYCRGVLIWPIGTDINSCYATGVWIDSYPWTDDTPWKDLK